MMKLIDSKWVFKIARDEKKNAARHKTRLCASGFRQLEGVYYEETFSPMIRYDSLTLFLAFVTHLDLKSLHFEIKTSFLYGKLQEEIFIKYQKEFA